ncbi:hypothetical protein ACVDFE_02940 [Lentzea chajnantorensis]
MLVLLGHRRSSSGGKAAEPSRQSSAVHSKSAVIMLVLVGSCWLAWLYEQARR